MYRSAMFAIATLALTGCTTVASGQDARPPAETVRVEQQLGRINGQLRPIHMLVAGRYASDAPFVLAIRVDDEGDDLGKVSSVGWTVKFGEYCRSRPSWVQSVLVGPTGRVWRGYRVAVPAGPDRGQDWSSGSTGANGPGAVATPGLLEAMDQGGRFAIALEDDEGQRWNEATIETLTRDDREALFAAEKDRRAAHSDKDSNSPGPAKVVALEPFTPPRVPRPCP